MESATLVFNYKAFTSCSRYNDNSNNNKSFSDDALSRIEWKFEYSN